MSSDSLTPSIDHCHERPQASGSRRPRWSRSTAGRRAGRRAGLLAGFAFAGTLAVTACSLPAPCEVDQPGCAVTNPNPQGAYGDSVEALPGLTLWAPLDEASGGTAFDHGPVAGHGTISASGVTYGAVDAIADANPRALGLASGVGSVRFPHRGALNLSTSSTARWSVLLDARVDATTGYPTLLSKGDWKTDGFALFADPASKAVGLIVNGQQSAWGGVSLSTTTHLAVSWDGSTLAFYANGTLVGSAAAPARTVTATGDLVLGSTGGVTVSKLAVATEANRSAIPALYRTLTGGTTSPTTAPPTTAPPTTAPPTTAPPTTTPPTTTPPTTTPNQAKVLWSDEFNAGAGAGVNTGTWEQQVGAPTNMNRVEYLTGGTSNVAHDGKGNLVITARREAMNGRAFTSGRIESRTSFTTGYLEFRAKVPTWQGTMPGLWTYGAAGYGLVSGYSEIDALEIQTANDIDPTSVRQTIHGVMADNTTLWQLGWQNNRVNYSPQRPGDAWHTYGAYVNPVDKSVTFYADGVVRARYAPGQQPAGGSWPYGVHAQKLIIEIEMGGYSRYPTADMNSDTLQVDYVRVYDKPPY